MRRWAGLGWFIVLLLPACAVAPAAATPRPSFLQNCAPTVPAGTPALTCDAAVSAALPVLAPNHPRITKVEFYYGYPCDPAAAPCPIGDGTVGYVVVQMAAPDSDQWIRVAANADGSVTAGQPNGAAPATEDASEPPAA